MCDSPKKKKSLYFARHKVLFNVTSNMSCAIGFVITLICASILICCYAKPQISSYKRELTLYNVEIILSRQLTTRRGSLVYAVCQQTREYLLNQMQCNATIEAPIFAKSVHNNTCRLHFVPENKQTDKITELKLHILNDHKVLFTWSEVNAQSNWRTNIRLLTMANCKFIDLSIPVRNIAHVITHKHGFDLIINYHRFCQSVSHCKLSYDINGKKMSGPIKILYDSDVPAMIPSVQPFLEEGYLLAGLSPRAYMVKVEADGKLKPLMAMNIPGNETLRATVSSLYGFYSLCAFVYSTTINCYLYDPRFNFRMNATLKFDDRLSNDTRWIAIRNCRGKSLILVTGKVSQNTRNSDNFSVFKLHSDGRWAKPIEIDGINFKGVDEFHVRMSKNKLDEELCFHFIGKQNKSYQDGTINRLKLAIKCLSKSFVNADNLLVIN